MRMTACSHATFFLNVSHTDYSSDSGAEFRLFCLYGSLQKYLMNRLMYLLAFDSWKKEQLDEKYIGAVYSMLAEKGKVLQKFPIEYLRKPLPADTLKVKN